MYGQRRGKNDLGTMLVRVDGKTYANGYGDQREQALRWYMRAAGAYDHAAVHCTAEAHHKSIVQTQVTLGKLFAEGRGVRINHKQSRALYNMAATASRGEASSATQPFLFFGIGGVAAYRCCTCLSNWNTRRWVSHVPRCAWRAPLGPWRRSVGCPAPSHNQDTHPRLTFVGAFARPVWCGAWCMVHGGHRRPGTPTASTSSACCL